MKILSQDDLSRLRYLAKSDKNKCDDQNYVYHVVVGTAYLLDGDIHKNRVEFSFLNFQHYSRFLGLVLLYHPNSVLDVHVTERGNPRVLTPLEFNDLIL